VLEEAKSAHYYLRYDSSANNDNDPILWEKVVSHTFEGEEVNIKYSNMDQVAEMLQHHCRITELIYRTVAQCGFTTRRGIIQNHSTSFLEHF
jgi:hypothetical protein